MAIFPERFIKAKRFKTEHFTLNDTADKVEVNIDGVATATAASSAAVETLGAAIGGNSTAMESVGEGLAGNAAAMAALAAALPPETVTTMVETPGAKTWSYINEGSTTKVMGNAQIVSAAVGNAITIAPDGGLVVQIPAQLPDDQVLSGDNSGTVNVTLTPDTTTTPGQTNYLLKADLKVAATNPDGSANALENTGNGFFVDPDKMADAIAGDPTAKAALVAALPAASSTVAGLTRYATNAETLTPTAPSKTTTAVTPNDLSYVLQTDQDYKFRTRTSMTNGALPNVFANWLVVTGNYQDLSWGTGFRSDDFNCTSPRENAPSSVTRANDGGSNTVVAGAHFAAVTASIGSGTQNSGTVYGLHGNVDAVGGTNIGVYGYAGGGTTNWAGYFKGNTKVTGKLQIAASNYADNAAALAAGLVVGDVYHTAGTLKIVI